MWYYRLKYLKYFSLTFVIATLCLITNVKASISDEDYARLREIFSEYRLSIMSDEELERLANGELRVQEKLYQWTESINGTMTYVEVDPDLYVEINPENSASNYSTSIGTTYYESNYKRIQIIDSYVTNNLHSVMVYTQWLVTPATKSFDVTAMRVEDATVVEGTQDGTQTYWADGSYNSITYSPNGTNIRKQSNGFGISMNLVNDASYFETDISADIKASNSNATVYGTYQHAVTNVTLEQSHSYNISHNGFGSVLNFATGVQNYYDRMQGVYVELGYY